MVLMVRADDRLIHGMVAVSWTSHLSPQTILVANDEAATDSFKTATMKLAKPAGVKLIIKTLEDSAKALNNPINDNKRIFLVTQSVRDAQFIFDRLSDKFRMLDIGTAGVHKIEGERYVATLPQVFMTRAEFESAKSMVEQGVEVFAQITPTRERMEFSEIEKIFAKEE